MTKQWQRQYSTALNPNTLHEHQNTALKHSIWGGAGRRKVRCHTALHPAPRALPRALPCALPRAPPGIAPYGAGCKAQDAGYAVLRAPPLALLCVCAIIRVI